MVERIRMSLACAGWKVRTAHDEQRKLLRPRLHADRLRELRYREL